MDHKPLPDLPKINLAFPSSPLIDAAFAHAKEITPVTVWRHMVRSAYFAVILSKKLPQFEEVDLDAVVVSCILHDLSWSTIKGVGAKDLRFEVDSAELARKWVHAQMHGGEGVDKWDSHREQLLWDAIALHTSPSFALHKESEVVLTHLGIMTDFFGDRLPGGAVSRDEFKEVVRAFPRVEWGPAGFKQIMCGLCERKPQTTLDNFVSEFGIRFGYDGEGRSREEYASKVKEASMADWLLGALEYSEAVAQEAILENK